MRPSRQISGRRGDEIGCVVDRHGRLLKGENGNNRFAIARMLGIRAIPVQIDAIHPDQMEIINQLPGWTPIARVNAYLARLQDRYAPQEQSRSRAMEQGRLGVSPAE